MPAAAAPSPAHPAAGDAQVHAFAEARFVDIFLSQNRRAQTGLFLAALLVAWVWFDTRWPALALAWLALVALVTALRFRHSETWIRSAEGAGRMRRVGAVLAVNGVLMAMPLLVFTSLPELERSALSIILLATATASVATTSGFRSVFLAFAAPMLVPLALAWAWVAWHTGNGAAWGMAGLILIFLLFLVSLGRQTSAVFLDACQFRWGQQQHNHELAQALDQAGEANRAKTQFLAAASHDLRQPIHSMNVLVAALSLRELEPGTREIVGLLSSVNQSLSKQLDTLLDISKLDAGIVEAQQEVLLLDRLVLAHHAAAEPVAHERGLRLELDSAECLFVRTDGGLLMRVLSNLSDNAIKYTPRGGVVRLVLRREGSDAVIEVTDNGIGIPADEQERVFREFYQVGNVERDRSKGLGLGLSIVQRLCALLGVRLLLRSAPGTGTTVTLRLPWVEEGGVLAVASARSTRPSGLRVLLIDDEAMVRESMRLLLAALGCTVHLADSAAAAVEIARQHPLDVVLSDFRLRGGETGLDAIHAVRTVHGGMPAVLITGDTAPERIRDARAVDVPLLFKPVTLDELIGVLPVLAEVPK